MVNKQTIKRVYVPLLVFCLLVSVLFGGRQLLSAYAAETAYTNVIDDLQKDEMFSLEDYPDNAEDYSIQVEQIAESVNNELFIYTYQPSQKTKFLTATDINMSLSGSVDGSQLYDLVLLSSEGVFCKYKVKDFVVKSEDAIRYYNISAIYRVWDASIDDETGNDNTKDGVAFSVGKLFRAKTENEQIQYYCENVDVIQIINPYVDFLEYYNGFKFCPDWCRSHYVAFSTDRQIDTLMEADVSYVSRSASKSTGLGLKGDTSYGEPEKLIAQLKGTDKGGNAADGFLSKKYEWERIQSVSDFIASEDLKDDTIKNLEGKEWVLRFTESTITMISGYGSTTTFWTDISEVTILRLKFVTAGKVYNLGAVSDKVAGDDKPGNNNTGELANLWEWLSRITGIPEWAWKLIAAAIILAIVIPLLSIFFPIIWQILAFVFKGVATGIVWLFKGIWWFICLPFKGIAALVQKIKNKGGGGE